MQLFDGANVVPDMPAPLAAGTPGWCNNTPGVGPGTVVTADGLNGVFAELLNVIQAAGITPSKTDLTQVLQAIQKISRRGVGEVFFAFRADEPAGALYASGKTIGGGASNATARANSDVQDLFTHLWTLVSNAAAALKLYSSAGAEVALGASAAADWTANRAIALPKVNGRVIFAKDDQGGTAENILTAAGGGLDGSKLGATGGVQAKQFAFTTGGPNSGGVFSPGTGPNQAANEDHHHVGNTDLASILPPGIVMPAFISY